jgi:pimeloyl-ACP methyl ester carboxylesterase
MRLLTLTFVKRFSRRPGGVDRREVPLVVRLRATSSASLRKTSISKTVPPPRRVDVPVACFPKDILVSTERWMSAQHNLVRWTEMPRGGHFAAMEEPELLAEDVRTFFRPLRRF